METQDTTAPIHTIMSQLISAEHKYEKYGLDSARSELGHVRTASALALLHEYESADAGATDNCSMSIE
jgi:hypothetical protein